MSKMNPINPTSISISHTPRRRGLHTPEIIRENPGLMITSGIAVLLLFTAFVAPVFAATKLADPSPEGMFSVMGTEIDTMTIDNGIYCVSVQGVPGYPGEGTYTVATSTGHPVPDKNVFYGGVDQDPCSTYLTVKVYDTGKEYVSTTTGPTPSSGCAVVSLDTCSPVTTQNGNHIHTTWTTPKNLLINQTIAVEGLTLGDSIVRVTTNITNNNNTATQQVGIRYMWDLMIDDKDGSWFIGQFHDANWIDTECEWYSPTFCRYNTTNDPNSPILTIVGTLKPTGALSPQPTAPDMLQFAAWSGVFDCAFDYTIGQTLAKPGNDSAIVYYWGNDEANAMTLNPGESVSATQYLYVTPPPPRNVPTLTSIGIVALAGLLVFIGAGVIVRGRRS